MLGEPRNLGPRQACPAARGPSAQLHSPSMLAASLPVALSLSQCKVLPKVLKHTEYGKAMLEFPTRFFFSSSSPLEAL